jgi:beta-galactosidase
MLGSRRLAAAPDAQAMPGAGAGWWGGGLVYGADYNPDQWAEEVWKADLDLMGEAGVTMVTLPVFGWARLEPTRDVFDFGWLDRVLELLWSRKIRVDLATATATPPAWLVREHPEVLPVSATGTRLEFGSRQTYCPSSPVFRERALKLCEAMALRYGDHPALAMWHVSNEYGDELSRCYCQESARHFRRWLRDRHEDIGRLNHAWGTDCWGQRYAAWEQIEPPRASTGPVNPAQRLDFERFSSHALIELFTSEAGLLRRITPHVPVTTNFMGLFRDVDYARLASLEDLVSNDAYPDPADPHSGAAAALSFSLSRSLKPGTPWLLMEQAPSAVSWREVNVPKPAGQMRLTSLQALAHGANGIMFFQWRASRAGAERFHSAMLGHRGTRGRTWAECRQLGHELEQLGEITASRVVTQVGVIVDWDSWWALSAPDSLPSMRLRWDRQVRSFHASLRELGVTADLVPVGEGLARYRLLVAPSLFLLDQERADLLLRFTEDGGHLLVGPFSGVVDANNTVHPGGAPGPLRDLLGIEVEEPWPLTDGVTVGNEGADTWAEAVEPVTAEVVAVYDSGPLTGRPALTRKQNAWYLSTCLDAAGTRKLLARVCRAAGVPTSSAPAEIVTRTGPDASYTFVLNHTSQPVTVDLPVAGLDLLTGHPAGGTVTVGATDALVIKGSTDAA